VEKFIITNMRKREPGWVNALW